MRHIEGITEEAKKDYGLQLIEYRELEIAASKESNVNIIIYII